MAYVKNINNPTSLFEINYVGLGWDLADSYFADEYNAVPVSTDEDGDDEYGYVFDIPAGENETQWITNEFRRLVGDDFDEKRFTITEYWA